MYLYLFDVLHLDHYDTTGLALRRRKQLLRRQFNFSGPLRFTVHRNADGQRLYRDACLKGWEGLIAKRADSTYRHSRSRHWLKFKCVNRQELVIGSYTEPKGSRTGFGALLLGYYEDHALRYAGKVGTGFDTQTLRQLGNKLATMTRKTCPYAETPDTTGDDVHWVTPELVAEIGFTEWTVEQRKNKRRGRIYLDVMRNAYGQTSVIPYSVRALSGAPIATPLDLAELGDRRLDPQRWHLKNILRRLGRKHDPWADIARHATGAGRAHRALRETQDN